MNDKKKYIYKYVKYDDAISTLKRNSVSLGNPLRFNDPFDCFIGIDEKNKEKSKALLEEFFYIKKFVDLLNSNELRIQRYQVVDKKLVDFRNDLINKREYYPNPFLYKTALYYLGEICTHESTYQESLEKEKEAFMKKMTSKLLSFQESALISCFCTRYDSILMWGHYAERDRGVCIEFEYPDNGNFYKVKYQKKRIPFNLYRVTAKVLGYLYTNDVIDESDDKLIKSIIEPYLTKSFEWKYEDEIRCVFSKSSKNDDIYFIEKPSRPEGVQYLYHMPTKVTKIFLGCKISSEREQNICELAKELNIPIVKMKPDNDIYRLDPIDIK